MRFLILGASGFVGQALTAHLLDSGHEVEALLRRPLHGGIWDRVRVIQGDPTRPGPWLDGPRDLDAVVNLTGRNIFARWNERIKKEILDSRLTSTGLAVRCACARCRPEGVLINANAVGFYGDTADSEVDESAPQGQGFLAEVCRLWQDAALAATSTCGLRAVVARFGAVLGRGGGALDQMLPPFRAGVGGRIGSGLQRFSWVHLTDLCRAVEFIARTPGLSGPINLTAPVIPSNAEFSALLGRALRRPAFIPVPAFVLRLFFGEVAQVLLTGQRTVPAKLLAHGFLFNFPDPALALADLLRP